MPQVTDRFLARLITVTVCGLAAILVGLMGVQALNGYESDSNLKELTYLIVGALVGQITTRGNKDEPEGTQQVSVPDPLPAPAPASVEADPVTVDSEFAS